MTHYLSLTHGSKKFDLTSAPYAIGSDFAPPALAGDNIWARATVGSETGEGADLVHTNQLDRDWQFSVRVLGQTDLDRAIAASRLMRFAKLYTDKSETLFLEYKNDVISYEPFYGQRARYKRYEIKYCDLNLAYYANQNDGVLIDCYFVVAPVALGAREEIALATGGVLQDITGAADGQSRGLIVPEATTNKITNPVYGNSIWDTGWTAQANVLAEQNTDPEFVLFGVNSVRLTAEDTNNNTVYYQSINVGNTNTHAFSCYVKKPDGSAVTTSDFRIYYNTSLTTTLTSVGDGWYRATATAAGINASTVTGGHAFTKGTVIYMDGFQVEEKSYATPLAYGDLLGCAWTSTAHASTSTRTAARVKIDITNHPRIGYTWCVVWKAPQAAADLGDARLLYEETNNHRLYFSTSTNVFVFHDGTNSASSAAQTFAAGDIIIIHCVIAADGYQIYVNGAASGSAQTTITPMASAPTWLHVGSNDSATPGEHCGGTFLAVNIYPVALSAAEIAAHYADLAAVVARGWMVDHIAHAWTKDGDGIVDNGYSLTDNIDNRIIIAGIAGDLPADTEILGNVSTGTFDQYLSLVAVSYQTSFMVNVSGTNYNIFFYDFDGSADSAAVSGEYSSRSMDTSYDAYDTRPIKIGIYKFMAGKDCILLWRAQATSDVDTYIQPYLELSSSPSNTITFDEKLVNVASANYELFETKPLRIPSRLQAQDDLYPGLIYIMPGFNVKIATGSQNFRFDYLALFPRPFLIINDANDFYIHGKSVSRQDVDYGYVKTYSYRGDILEFMPGMYNLLQQLKGDDSNDPVKTITIDYNLWYTPRYALL
jgi:hypothetical protein